MTTITLSQEYSASRNRFQRTLMISLGLHLLLFAWVSLRDKVPPLDTGIVEVAWLDPAPTPLPVPTPIKAVPKPVKAPPKPVAPSPVEEKFKRQEQAAAVKPTPQMQTANRDRVKDRMAALTPKKLSNNALTASTKSSRSLLKSAPAAVGDPGLKAPAVDLKRAESTRPAPTALKRAQVKRNRGAPALASVEREKFVGTVVEMSDQDATARRTLEGAELAGQIANRPVLDHMMPTYPEWAKNQAVEATVTLYFIVMPDGRVKENIQVQKTAGFSDFDQSAIEALSRWRFQALSGGQAREQWGTITFRFRLRNN